MELTEIRTLLETYVEPEGRLSVLFVTKNGTKYTSFKPTVSNDVQKEVVKLFKDSVQSKINSDLAKVPFNPSGHENDEFSECQIEYLGNYSEVINLFDEPGTEEIEPDDVSFLIFRLRINKDQDPTKYLYLFRKNHKLKNIRKGFWMRKVNDTFNILEGSKLMAIDGWIDAISLEDEVIFFNHISAERIFNLREKYKENAEVGLEEVQRGNKIQNFDQFRDDCLEDARIIRRLTKIQSNPQIIELFHAHFSNAPEVVELFDLNIDFNTDKTQIVYADKDQLTHITMLMRDAYYRTVLANRKGVDDFNV
ncbi:Kiwa anti-phage protein KwaB-like domain-containing protein [Virgibacillus litoralis]|uniref:Nucleic acid-binding protein n=1 Tax=Virgibacillus litoralis TaxID=578221 RepID=A0ABS4HHG5_9BACI|nr:Kiwa anti-phage protein KwaB-like domain-containing protein [Virgibacillus litoralis]MBP1950278.1 putative nucleic acid-binding protein [Virgibacillus litoralis]